MSAEKLAKCRRSEAKRSAKLAGAAVTVLDNRDGELMPTLGNRRALIRILRERKADVVFTHRSNDYHPDHRYTSLLVQDAAYMVLVPKALPQVPVLSQNPVFLYFEDSFQKPNPFKPDIAVAIDSVLEQKYQLLDAHTSQFYQWLPWVDGIEQVPEDANERLLWLRKQWPFTPSAAAQVALANRYGVAKAKKIAAAEAFERCEYGRDIDATELMRWLPL